jgi:effector-binding domain-containing protein
VKPLVVPAAELAVTTHHGSLSDIDLTYAELGSYVATHEISVDGPLRESYLCDAHDTPDEDRWETELGWPVFRADDNSSDGNAHSSGSG